MTTFQLRDANAGDRPAIRAVTLAAYEQYAALVPPPAWAMYRDNILATLAAEQPAEQIVAEQGGTVVGTVLLFPAGTVFYGPERAPITLAWPEVRLLAVLPAARGRGVGRALMEECIRRACRAGSAVLALHTTDMMQAAMRLYEQMGFVRAPELDFQPDPAVVVKGYRLELGAREAGKQEAAAVGRGV